jgi:hypothetical protein
MDRKTFERLVRSGKITAGEVLAHASIDTLDEALTVLKRHCAGRDVCDALVARIAKAPLQDFEALKALYFRHCGATPH